MGRGDDGDLGQGSAGDLGRRIGLPGLSVVRSDGSSLRPMRGEFIGDAGGVLTVGSFSSGCLTAGTALQLRGLISSTHTSLDLAEPGLFWVLSDLEALNGVCCLGCGFGPLFNIP